MKQRKYLIFDAGPLINFAMNGLLPLLRRLKEKFDGDFIITKEVKEEVIDNPSRIKRFELGAFQLKELFDDGIIKHADLTSQQVIQLKIKRNEIMETSNSLFEAGGNAIHLIDKGEAAALALSYILDKPNAVVIDERTARMLVENPENERLILEKKLHTIIVADKSRYNYLKGIRVIRSSELIYIAHKLGLIRLNNTRAYEAMLYAVKYKGCSISEEEIVKLTKL